MAWDFNNVLSLKDRVGGAPVQIHEFQDLKNIMGSVGLFECQSVGGHFTWLNRHKQGIIYS